MVVETPLQTEVCVAEAVTTGNGFTLTVIVPVPVHPIKSDPVTL